MANTPQSKKRARQNERRYEVNKARRSRIRTFLRKVEEAIASGDQAAAADRAPRRAARADARRHQGR
jgi:small subunit ribosomal protein S20